MDERDDDSVSQSRGVLPSRERDEVTEAGAVDPGAILEGLEALDVRTWRETAGATADAEHLGPAAEDFHEAFELGVDGDDVTAGDADGVALAAIQGLIGRLDEQDARLERQADRIEAFCDTVEKQRDDLETLRVRIETLQSELTRLRAGRDDDHR